MLIIVNVICDLMKINVVQEDEVDQLTISRSTLVKIRTRYLVSRSRLYSTLYPTVRILTSTRYLASRFIIYSSSSWQLLLVVYSRVLSLILNKQYRLLIIVIDLDLSRI